MSPLAHKYTGNSPLKNITITEEDVLFAMEKTKI
jgi:hypothetical protein